MRVLDHPETPLERWMGEGVVTDRPDGAGTCAATARRARAALTPSGLSGFDWALNPYVGCAHRCAYCYAPSVLGMERDTWGLSVEARQNIPVLLSRELRRKERGVVGISTVTDPYQPAERRYQITRNCLELLSRHDWPVCVLTKSDLVVRDMDVLEGFSDCEVGLTITTLDEHQRRLMEPGAPPIPRRLAAMRILAEAGIRTYAFVGPVYPTATLNELRNLVRQVHDAGGRYILVDRMNLKSGVWRSITRALGGDRGLMSTARRRMFPAEGEATFYQRALSTLEEEARALGLPTSQA